MEEKNKPVKTFRCGGVKATIWNNKNDKGEFYTVSVTRIYKDKKDEWKDTNSMRVNDLPKLSTVCSKAFEYINLKEDNNND